VAIKRLHPHLAKEAEFVSMLTDEARVTGRIGHLNLVPTLDVVAVRGESRGRRESETSRRSRHQHQCHDPSEPDGSSLPSL
jgi:hypothetical protein